jgi:hypothetical protein
MITMMKGVVRRTPLRFIWYRMFEAPPAGRPLHGFTRAVAHKALPPYLTGDGDGDWND